MNDPAVTSSYLTASRIHLVIAALMGLTGTALLAAAAHVNGATSVQTAGQFLLFHAPAVMGITAGRRLDLIPMRWGANVLALLILGVVLFSADLALRGLAGRGVFPMAAPIGGSLIMLGWSGIAICALVKKSS